MKKILFIMMLGLIYSEQSPCNDELYLELKKKNLNNMTDREYEYFINKDKQCNQYIPLNRTNNQSTSNIRISNLKFRKNIDLSTFVFIYGLTLGVDAIVSGQTTNELLIPGFGPFLIKEPNEDFKSLAYLSGFLQISFLIDYFLTTNKINKINENLDLSFNKQTNQSNILLTYKF